jgi:hypothetical protein
MPEGVPVIVGGAEPRAEVLDVPGSEFEHGLHLRPAAKCEPHAGRSRGKIPVGT